jgi:hypothetical protein
LQLNKIKQKHHQHIGLVQALSMAFVKDVHCIPLGFGCTVFGNLHALLCSSQVSASIVQNPSYRLSVHAISFSHSIFLTRRRLGSSVAKKGIGWLPFIEWESRNGLLATRKRCVFGCLAAATAIIYVQPYHSPLVLQLSLSPMKLTFLGLG